MVTLAELRIRVRLRLEDTGASEAWSDEEIDAGLSQALDDYSQRFPEERRTMITVEEGVTSVDVPEDSSKVIRVIDPAGRMIPPQRIPLRGTAGQEQAWEVWGDRIEFSRRLPAGEVTVWYLGARQFPEEDSETFPLPAEDVSLLVLGAVVWSLEQRSVADWKRGALPARYEMVLRRAREEYRDAWQSKLRSVRVGRLTGTG